MSDNIQIRSNQDMSEKVESIVEQLGFIAEMDLAERVEAINRLRAAIHAVSPFKSEPVDFVRWERSERVQANDYNPNSVAPPEMELLRTSIMADGYTQPIVANLEDDKCVVIDGFHRNRVGKECPDVMDRIQGYLPVVQIRETQAGVEDRMASTIRHNRARGKHKVEAMSDIVIELKRRNWTNARISQILGMDEDEILRLCQISGLADIFADQDFSRAWDLEGEVTDADFEELTDDIDTYSEEERAVRTVNTNDENRVFHTFDKWECHKAGFYKNTPPKGMTKEECKIAYRDFLSDLSQFEAGLEGVTSEWKHSCEHYLTNAAMNRIAWLGQAAMCYSTGVPAEFRGGFSLMTAEQQDAANELALTYLNKWLTANDMAAITMNEAMPSRQSDIY